MTRTRRDIASLMLSQFATQIVTLLLLTVVPRFIGVKSYGELAFAGTFVGFFSLVSALGTRTFVVKEVARHPELLSGYLVNAAVMKLALGTVLALAAAGVARGLGYSGQIVLFVEIMGIGMVLTALSDVLQAGLQATGRMGQMALWGAVQQYVIAGLVVGVLVSHLGGVVWVVLLNSLGQLIAVAAFGHKLWPELRGHLDLNGRIWRTIATGGIPFGLWSAILMVYGSIDIIMLQSLCGSTTVAWYNLAYTWVGIPIFLPTILTTAFLPMLSAMALTDPEDFTRKVNRALRVTVLAGTPMAVGVALLAGDVISLLRYPSGYRHAVPLIQILAFHIPIVGIDMVLATALIARDRQTAWLIIGILASVFNPLVNLAAIPWAVHHYSNGAVGASIVTVLTELIMMIGALILRPTGVMDRATAFYAFRCVLASAAMIPPVIVIASFPAKIAVGVSVFAVAAFVLRLISIKMIRGGVDQTLDVLRRRALTPVPTAVE